MQVTIVGQTADELRTKVLDLAKIFMGSLNNIHDDQMTFPAEVLNPVQGAKRGRKPNAVKVEEVAPTPVVAATVINPVPATEKSESTTLTAADAKAALEKVHETLGIEDARGVLLAFSCQRFSELPEAKYGDFIGACDDRITNAQLDASGN